jgi:hypothetical protein
MYSAFYLIICNLFKTMTISISCLHLSLLMNFFTQELTDSQDKLN